MLSSKLCVNHEMFSPFPHLNCAAAAAESSFAQRQSCKQALRHSLARSIASMLPCLPGGSLPIIKLNSSFTSTHPPCHHVALEGGGEPTPRWRTPTLQSDGRCHRQRPVWCSDSNTCVTKGTPNIKDQSRSPSLERTKRLLH